MSNPVAEVMDVFFNGRPAPKRPNKLRVTLTKQQLRDIESGSTVTFKASGIEIQVAAKS